MHMNTLGPTVVVKGEVHSGEDLLVEGRIEGPVSCEHVALTLAATASVAGRIIARDITVLGRVEGQLIATDVVDVRAEAVVTGQVNAARFILNEGARFDGRVEPQHLDAALRVAKFQQRDRAC
jgi:cytoskeletal protein CcmA (bactofilin family)